ncbi:exported hypothetical protein [uncultured Desulfatiglans sp.]|nr:exported hypothetical protein [uncultured Desulfatiglans sp.]
MRRFIGYRKILLLPAAVLALCLTSSCARPPVEPLQSPYSPPMVTSLVAGLEHQKGLVSSAVCAGTLTVGENGSASKVSLLMAGRLQPLTVKIEMTHFWGNPLLHILVRNDTVEVLSFRDKKLLIGSLRDPLFEPYLPGILDPSALWALVRAYPDIGPYEKALSLRPQEIQLLDEAGKPLQTFAFDVQAAAPTAVHFPAQGLTLYFDRFARTGPIDYAKRCRIEPAASNRFIEIQWDDITFNRTLPEPVFALQVPPGYRIVEIERRALE